MNNPLRIFQFASNPVCAPYRFEFPRKHLNLDQRFKVTQFHRLEARTYTEIAQSADVLIVQRLQMSRTFATLCRALEALGKLIIYDIDDDLLNLMPGSRYAQRAPNDYGDRIKQAVQLCHAVQCSTETLAQTIRSIHPEVGVLQNQLDRVLPLHLEREPGRPVIIGYAAGEDHLLDWLTIKDVYNRVIRDFGTSGIKTESWIIGDHAIFETLETEDKRYFPSLPRQDYLSVLKKMDIALLPLLDHPFNHCKSDIKFLESAATGCAVLASPQVYGQCVEHGQTGMLYRDPEQFVTLVKKLVTSPELVACLARKAHQYVASNRLIEQHIGDWKRTYNNWWSRKAELLAKLNSC